MATCLVETHSEPERIEVAHLDANAKLVPTTRGSQLAELIRIQFDKLRLGRFHESGARIRHVRQNPTRAFVKFQVVPGSGLIIDSAPVPADSIIRHAQAEDFTERTTGPTDWATLSLPWDDMIVTASAFSGLDLTPPDHFLLVEPPPDALARLRRLHAAAACLAKDAPHVLAGHEAARSLEQSLIGALVPCLTGGEPRDGRMARQSRRAIIRRFLQLMEENVENPMYVPEICRAIDVRERSLRACCYDYLGTSPKQYLTLRRMNMARRALLSATDPATTVTEIATRFGFWQFGHFSLAYRSWFGESPSVTLRRSRT